MKKTIFALSLCAVLMLLSACGKSQAVKDVEKAISEIGDVTIESAEAIQNAQKLYNFLTDNEKEQVENRLTLMSAQDAYDEALRERTKQELAQVYSELKGAYESVEWFGADLYTVWFGENIDKLHVAATFNLAFNGALFVREGMGIMISLDKLVSTGEHSDLVFRPITGVADAQLKMVWKKNQPLPKTAQLLIDAIKEELSVPESE